MTWRRPSSRPAQSGDPAATAGAETTWQRALDTALHYLGPRPRSERELRQRLARDQVPEAVIEDVIQRLRGCNLLDDAAFARYWIEQRQTFRPRGVRALKAELRQRGVAGDLLDDACEAVADSAETDAYRVAVRRAQQLAHVDQQTFRTRIGQLLVRRGFDWDVVRLVVERLWQERAAASGELGPVERLGASE